MCAESVGLGVQQRYAKSKSFVICKFVAPFMLALGGGSRSRIIVLDHERLFDFSRDFTLVLPDFRLRLIPRRLGWSYLVGKLGEPEQKRRLVLLMFCSLARNEVLAESLP